MHPLRHRDLDHRDLVHHSVHDLVYLQRLQYLDRLNDTDHLMLVHLFRCVVEIVNLDQMHRQDVEKMDVLQILDEQNLDEVLTFQDVAVHRLVVVVGVVLFHQLKMDYCLDVAGEELRHQLKMDCYLDVVQVLEALIFLQRLLLQHVSLQILPLLLQRALVVPSVR